MRLSSSLSKESEEYFVERREFIPFAAKKELSAG